MANVKVLCRFRPMNSREKAEGSTEVVRLTDTSVYLSDRALNKQREPFNFDRVFDKNASQEEVYNMGAKPVVLEILKGFNGTIFAYGQTGSGKTHTMQGPDIFDPVWKGIIPRIIETLFTEISEADENLEFLVKVSYMEIYLESLRDLLDPSKDNLKIREHKTKGVYVDGITEEYVACEEDVIRVMEIGGGNRKVSATEMNAVSSRSHSIFIMQVIQKDLTTGSTQSGKLFLVDLAGSEKVGKTGATGQTLNEARNINKSLSALGNVINALTDGKSKHIPYRDSKLTRLLQESLGGNAMTTLCINCSPSSFNEKETLGTLRFGTRAKSIKNKPTQNKERSVAELTSLLNKSLKEIKMLKQYIRALEEELQLYRGDTPSPLKRPPGLNLSPGNGDASSGGSGLSVPLMSPASKERLPNVAKIQDQVTSLEQELKEKDEEAKKLLDQKDTLEETLSKKENALEQYIEQQMTLKEELANALASQEAFEEESQVLLGKVTKLELAHEKLGFENTEKQLTIDSLNEQVEAMKEEMETLRREVTVAEEERTALDAERKKEHDRMDRMIAMEKEQSKYRVKEQEIRAALEADMEAMECSLGLSSDSLSTTSSSNGAKDPHTPSTHKVMEALDALLAKDTGLEGAQDSLRVEDMAAMVEDASSILNKQQQGEEEGNSGNGSPDSLLDTSSTGVVEVKSGGGSGEGLEGAAVLKKIGLVESQLGMMRKANKKLVEEKHALADMIRDLQHKIKTIRPSPSTATPTGPRVGVDTPPFMEVGDGDVPPFMEGKEKEGATLNEGIEMAGSPIHGVEPLVDDFHLDLNITLDDDEEMPEDMVPFAIGGGGGGDTIDSFETEMLRKELADEKRTIAELRAIHQTQGEEVTRLRKEVESKGKAASAKEEHWEQQDAERRKKLEQELNNLRTQTAKKLKEFDTLKASLLKDLQNRCEKVIDLEMLLDEAREQYEQLLKSSSNKSLQKRNMFLERNLEQLTRVHQELVNQNNQLRLEKKVSEKKLAARNERIQALELLLTNSQEKLHQIQSNHHSEISKYKALLEEVKTRAASSNNSRSKRDRATSFGKNGGRARIARPIRGGGGKRRSPTDAVLIAAESTVRGRDVPQSIRGGGQRKTPSESQMQPPSTFTSRKKSPRGKKGSDKRRSSTTGKVDIYSPGKESLPEPSSPDSSQKTGIFSSVFRTRGTPYKPPT